MAFKTCPPNEALVISGGFRKSPKLVVGKSKWIWPLVNKVQRLNLSIMPVNIYSRGAKTADGVKTDCFGTALIKIPGKDRKLLETAARNFVGKTTNEIKESVRETIEAHQRTAIETMTIKEIYQDRMLFEKEVFENAFCELLSVGISVVSYSLLEVKDDEKCRRVENAMIERDTRMEQAETMRKSTLAYLTELNQQTELQDQNILRLNKKLEMRTEPSGL